MNWAQWIGPGVGLLGIVIGGLIAKWTPKTNKHYIVVTDAVSFAAALKADNEERDRRIDALEAKMQKRDNLARQHIRWDWRMLEKLRDAGVEVPENPPPLFVFED